MQLLLILLILLILGALKNLENTKSSCSYKSFGVHYVVEWIMAFFTFEGKIVMRTRKFHAKVDVVDGSLLPIKS
jgi:hypothetical protein